MSHERPPLPAAHLADKSPIERLQSTLQETEALLAQRHDDLLVQRFALEDKDRLIAAYEAERRTFGAQIGRWLSRQRRAWVPPSSPQGKLLGLIMRATRTLHRQSIAQLAPRSIRPPKDMSHRRDVITAPAQQEHTGVNAAVAAQVLSRQWSYPFRLPSGQLTDCDLPDITAMQRTRERMLFHVLEPLFQGRWEHVRAVDLACGEGYVAFSLARRGCQEVTGFEARPEKLYNAQLMRTALGMTNTRFELVDVLRLDPRRPAQFDLTVLCGLLDQVYDPIGLLRLARALTTSVCVIETQVVPNLSTQPEGESYQDGRSRIGYFGVLDAVEHLEAPQRAASATPLALVPTLPALLHSLHAVGFTRVEVVPPPPHAAAQLASGQRVMVAAFVEPAGGEAASSQWTMEYQLDMPLRYILAQMQDRTISQSTYWGVPAQKSPTDFWIYQELLHRLQPDVIVEIGNYCGGSTLALAHLCDLIGKGRVIGVDVSHHLIPAIVQNHPRITLLEGHACARFADVRQLIGPQEHTLVIEDSAHTYETTLQILHTYAALVQVGDYFIVEDSICWHGLERGPRPGPYEAIETFLATDARFEADRSQEGFVITWNPMGYLKRVR